MSEQQTPVIVVLGMHRSGTSAVTRGLEVLGVRLGENLLPAAEDQNPKGFWEDVGVVNMNIRLLQLAGRDWHSAEPIDPGIWNQPAVDRLRAEARQLVKSRLRSLGLWGFKDPRSCRLLPFWQLVFRDLDVADRYVIVARNPDSVAKSLQRRDGLLSESSYLLWLGHMIPALESTAGKPRVVADYDYFLANARPELGRVAAALQLKTNDRGHPSRMADFVEKFLDRSLNHGRQGTIDVNCSARVRELVIRLDRLLKLAAMEKQKPSDDVFLRAVNEIARDFDGLRPLLACTDQLERSRSAAKTANREIEALRQSLAGRDRELQVSQRSICSRAAALPPKAAWMVRRVPPYVAALRRLVTRCGGWQPAVAELFNVLGEAGLSGLGKRLLVDRAYHEWVKRYDSLDEAARTAMRARSEELRWNPLISVVMPLADPGIDFLDQAMQSVRNQLYSHWELCICDDASRDPRVRQRIARAAAEDRRIKVALHSDRGGLASAASDAFQMCNGEYVTFVAPDALLAEHALFYVANAVMTQPDARLIYSDEDRVDVNGERFDAQFKCDWNPDLFLSYNLIGHLAVYEADLVRSAGGFCGGPEVSLEYDLALRCIERVDANRQSTYHIPRILYHRRSSPQQAEHVDTTGTRAVAADVNALNSHFRRVGADALASLHADGVRARIRYSVSDPDPPSSVIVLADAVLASLWRCLDSIYREGRIQPRETLVVVQGDRSEIRNEVAKRYGSKVRVIDDVASGLWATVNRTVRESRGDVIGLLHSDVEVMTSDWLDELPRLAIRDDIAVVGARLWAVDDTLLHGGLVLGVNGYAGLPYRGLPRKSCIQIGRVCMVQNFSAVWPVCMFFRKSVFEQLRGFDECSRGSTFAGIDFCLRARNMGLRTVWTPHVDLRWHAIDSARRDDRAPVLGSDEEAALLRERWGWVMAADSAYNPNLTLGEEDFSLAWPPRVVQSLQSI